MQKKTYPILPSFIVPLAGMGTDIYLPSLPAMMEQFAIDKSSIQLSLTAYVLAMGFAQLLAGPISDAYGRKKQLLIALTIQIIALIAIIFSHNIAELIIARFFQGLGGAFMIVPGRAILNDCFSGEILKKKFNYLTISFALAPILAPFIGGYCEHYLNWQASFVFLLVYAVVLFIYITFFYHETLDEKKYFSLSHLVANYRTILSNKIYLYSSILLGVLFGYTSFFNVLGPFIFQSQLKVSALMYGYIALTIGIAWFLGNVTNRILFRIDPRAKVRFALSVQLIVILSTLLFVFLGYYSLFIILPIFLLVFTTGMIFPIFVGESLSLFPSLAASANACLFAITWLAFGFYTLVATLISVKTLLPLVLSFLAVNALAHVLYRALKEDI